MLTLLEYLKQKNQITELNYQFAKMIAKKQQGFGYNELQQNLAIFLSALLSFYTQKGHSCLLLDSSNLLISQPFLLNKEHSRAILQKIDYLSPLEWQTTLSNHIAFSDDPIRVTPFLFQHQRLYFYRYWQAEFRVAQVWQQAVKNGKRNADYALDKQILARFFTPQKQIDYQMIAVATALNRSFSLISGGPGTGKTTTVTKLLAVLQLKQQSQGSSLKMALVAPTGKAAARLKESIEHNLQQLVLPESIKSQIATQASTIHSLLGIRPNHDLPRYHSQNLLSFDLVVVDEASMVDLFIMEKLCNALKPSARLILLGDKDQLASVEAGSAMSELGDLLEHYGYSEEHREYLSKVTGYTIEAKNAHPLAICDSLCHLEYSYRFDENSGIGELAKSIKKGYQANSWQIFTEGNFSDLTLHLYPDVGSYEDKFLWVRACSQKIIEEAVTQYQHYFSLVKQRIVDPNAVSVTQIFAEFQKVRFLSALRVSELGVVRLNQDIAEALQDARFVEFTQSRENYMGKPILITENSPQNHIFSGDVGIVLPNEQGKPRIYFESQRNGVHFSISPSRVPNYEPAYVMTVHKSQGSEFEHTFLIMPQSYSPVLTRELVYTAVTRAKKKFTLFSNEVIWKRAVKEKISRQSGLKAQLLALEHSV